MITIKEGNNKFYIGDTEESAIAKVTYINSGDDKIIIDHTFVSDELRGQRIGQQLIKRVVDFARQANKKIVPQCSFAEKEFDRNEDYGDVLYR